MAEDSKNDKVSTDSYKGVRDFYPEDQFIQNYIFSTWRKAAESFGYKEYSASILEPASLYKNKTSQEIVDEQTYTFTDRGGREVTLRPEMTPTVARMIARKRKSLAFPQRWYSIPNVFRYEKPQRGRLREHWQLNADIFGMPSIEAEIEIIELAVSVLKSFGLKEKDLKIYLNDRKFLLEELGKLIPDESLLPEALRLIDKKKKITAEEFDKEWSKLSDKPFELKPGNAIDDLMERLEERGIDKSTLEYEPTMVRGFDYYTGTIFEIFDTDPENNRSLAGGGRYDNLMDIFGEESVPAVGFGMGDVTIKDALESRGLLPEYKSPTDLYICTLDEKQISYAKKFQKRMQDNGLNVEMDYSFDQVSNQIKRANKLKARFVVCIGEAEVEGKDNVVKELSSGQEKLMRDLSTEQIVDWIKSKR